LNSGPSTDFSVQL